MRELFRFKDDGATATQIATADVPSSVEDAILQASLAADKRLSRPPFALTQDVGGGAAGKYALRRMTRSSKELRRFAEAALPSRVVTILRDGVGKLDYALKPKDSQMRRLRDRRSIRAADTVRRVLDKPNSDDTLPEFVGSWIEDLATFDAGVWEMVRLPESGPNPYLSMVPVSGDTVAKNVKWNGDPKMPLWGQIAPHGQVAVQFLPQQICYSMRRKRTHTPYGYSPLEAAIEVVEAIIRAHEFAAESASSAFTRIITWLGPNAPQNPEQIRHLWENVFTGTAAPGYIWGMEKPENLKMGATGDEQLFLKWQELLWRLLFIVFGLPPIKAGIERDVNRNTAEVQRQDAIEEAIRPLADLLAAKFNDAVLPAIAEMSGMREIEELEFFWSNLDPRDEERDATVAQHYYQMNVLTPDDLRDRLGMSPYPNGIGQLPRSAFEPFVSANPDMALDDDARAQFDQLLPSEAPDDMLPPDPNETVQ